MDKIAARLRPRSKWEAVDLGFALVRAWWQPMLIAWLLVCLPVATLIGAIAFVPSLIENLQNPEDFASVDFWSAGVVASITLWWLKPAFERAPLYVLGEAMFGQVPTFRQILKALPKLYWNNGIFASLTWRRLNPGRTFDFPIRQLEGSKGKFAKQRRRALNPYGWSATATCAWVLVHAETVLPIALGVLINMFWIGDDIFSFDFDLAAPENKLKQEIGQYVLYVLVLSFLELFYVAVGFALYLNARNALEGWDIELAFKNLRTRVDAVSHKRAVPLRGMPLSTPTTPATQATSAKVLSVLAIGGLLLLFNPSNGALAATDGASKPGSKGASTAGKSVLAERGEANVDEVKRQAAIAVEQAKCAAQAGQVEPSESASASPANDDGKKVDNAAACEKNDEKNADSDTDDALEKSDNRASSSTKPKNPDAQNGQTRDARQAAVGELISDPRMGTTREKTKLRYVGPTWDRSEEKQKPKADLAWMKSFAGFIASAFQYIGWGLLVLLIIYLLHRGLKNRGWFELQGVRAPMPDTLFGLDVRPESLPDDVPAVARALLAKGDIRGALALIYRATLVFLLQDGKVEIANGDTEGDCLRRVQAGYTASPSFNNMLRALFNAWLWVAYKGAPLAITECEQLIGRWQTEMQAVKVANQAAVQVSSLSGATRG